MAKTEQTVIEIAGQEVQITNPGKIFFPKAGYTKLDLVNYYAAGRRGRDPRRGQPAHGAQALRERRGRGAVLSEARAGEASRLDRHRGAELPSGRTACEIVVNNAAQLLWIINLGCID